MDLKSGTCVHARSRITPAGMLQCDEHGTCIADQGLGEDVASILSQAVFFCADVGVSSLSEDGETIKAYETGYPLGFVNSPIDDQGEEVPKEQLTEPSKIFLFNHLRFTILYHEDPNRHGIRIVGFEVEPFSVKHSYINQVDWKECLNKMAGAGGKCNMNTVRSCFLFLLDPLLLLPDMNSTALAPITLVQLSKCYRKQPSAFPLTRFIMFSIYHVSFDSIYHVGSAQRKSKLISLRSQ